MNSDDDGFDPNTYNPDCGTRPKYMRNGTADASPPLTSWKACSLATRLPAPVGRCRPTAFDQYYVENDAPPPKSVLQRSPAERRELAKRVAARRAVDEAEARRVAAAARRAADEAAAAARRAADEAAAAERQRAATERQELRQELQRELLQEMDQLRAQLRGAEQREARAAARARQEQRNRDEAAAADAGAPLTAQMTTTRCSKDLPDVCSVCYDKIVCGQLMSMPSACLGTGTVHAFHEACLTPWMKRKHAAGRTCPICRR